METGQRAKCSRRAAPPPPPPTPVSMGTELGRRSSGGAAAADVACAGLAWGQEGRHCAWQQGPGTWQAGVGCSKKPGAGGLPPPGCSPDSSGPQPSTGCSRLTFGPHPAGPRPCQHLLSLGLGLSEGAHVCRVRPPCL